LAAKCSDKDSLEEMLKLSRIAHCTKRGS